MKTAPSKIIVMVRGGLVQAVHTDDPSRIKVEVFDLDAGSFETPAERIDRESREAEYERRIDGMTEVRF